MSKPYVAKTLSGAQAEVRRLRNYRHEREKLIQQLLAAIKEHGEGAVEEATPRSLGLPLTKAPNQILKCYLSLSEEILKGTEQIKLKIQTGRHG